MFEDRSYSITDDGMDMNSWMRFLVVFLFFTLTLSANAESSSYNSQSKSLLWQTADEI